jgi:hypothetical protein
MQAGLGASDDYYAGRNCALIFSKSAIFARFSAGACRRSKVFAVRLDKVLASIDGGPALID